jgi:hypothetical protein
MIYLMLVAMKKQHGACNAPFFPGNGGAPEKPSRTSSVLASPHLSGLGTHIINLSSSLYILHADIHQLEYMQHGVHSPALHPDSPSATRAPNTRLKSTALRDVAMATLN